MERERRKNERFQPDDVTFVVLRPDFTKLGKLIDISARGLSFQHMAGKGEKDSSVHLDIFKGDNSFYLSKVPCRVVYDCEGEASFCHERWRCGVEFADLTEEQRAWLNNYIQRIGAESKGKEGNRLCCQ